MNAKPILIIILFLSGFTTAITQNKTSPREMFLEAESYFLYEEYTEALPLYIQLSIFYPDNDNINYKLGRCYLNIPYEKEKSIDFLEKAAKNINPKYKGDNLKETASPPDVIFYLGDAYRINNQLDKAISLYRQFKQTSDPSLFDHEMIDDQIRSCENAKKLLKQPVAVEYKNLGDVINSRFSESNPVISGDETILVYSVQLQFYTAVYFSNKQNGNWSIPVNINPDLGVDTDCYPVGISHDGKELLLYRSNEYLGDIYTSRFVNGKWTKIKKLNGNINTRFWESHACLSRDGKRLFFTSNRKGGSGGLDIYISTRKNVTDDDWGPARNLGTVINSPLNEETPFITSDDQKLYFSSLGHNGMGGYDVFVSEALKDGGWGKPRNVGFPVNSTDHDLFFQPVSEGNEGYIALFKKENLGRTDIYKIKLLFPEEKLASINETLKEPEEITPSSEINKSVIKAEGSRTEAQKASFIARVNNLNNQAEITKTAVQTEIDTTSENENENPPEEPEIQKSVEEITLLNEPELSEGQKQAWHKLLYGGIGILAVFIFFILHLYLRSRKRKRNPNS